MNARLVATALSEKTESLADDQPEDGQVVMSTERVPGAARNEPDGMPAMRLPYRKTTARFEAASPTVPTGSPWEEEYITEQDSNRATNAQEPVFVFPKPTFSHFKSELLQQWEGTVVEVVGNTMRATLRNLTEPESAEEQAAIDLNEVPDADRSLVEIGAVFYWSIGYRVEPHGQKTLTSNIRFRRLPAWTTSEIERAKRFASKFDALFEST